MFLQLVTTLYLLGVIVVHAALPQERMTQVARAWVALLWFLFILLPFLLVALIDPVENGHELPRKSPDQSPETPSS